MVRWIPFALVLYVALVLQTAFAPFIAIHSVRPDFMLILAVHFALQARRYDALIACWIIGLATDLAGTSFSEAGYSNLGVSALAMGLIGLVIVNIRELTFRESPTSQLFISFFSKLALNLLVGSHMLYVLHSWNRFGEVLTAAMGQALYTAAVGLYAFWLLRQMRFALGIGASEGVRAR